jgi:hypothetical protein
MKKLYPILMVGTLVLLQGCASIKQYPGTHNKNLTIRTTADSGSSFSNVSIFLDVYEVNNRCEAKFLGTAELENKKNRVGIPVGDYSLLSFRFQSSSFWQSSSGSTTFDTLLKPRKGYEYDIYARYVNGIYNVDITEYYKGRKKRHISPRELHECRR